MRMKRRTIAVLCAAAAAAAALAVVVAGRGRGAPDPLAGLSPADRALVAGLGPNEQRTVLASYAAAKAEGKRTRIADLMPEAVYSVQEAVARRATLRAYLDTSGDVVTKTSVVAYPDIGGRVASVSVKPGDYVREGGLLAQVDPSSPGSSYALSSVRAPIAGTVTSLAVQVGTRVTTGSAVATVGALDELEIDVLVRERDVALVRLGQRAVLGFEAYPGESFEAEVAELSPVLDPASRTRTAVLSLRRPDARVAPGMYAKVRIYTDALAGVVTLPEEAIFQRYGESYVFVIARKDGADRAELRKVAKGAVVDGIAEAKEGLADGERVVTAGRTALADGALVRVVSGRAAAPAQNGSSGQGAAPAQGASRGQRPASGQGAAPGRGPAPVSAPAPGTAPAPGAESGSSK